MVEGIPVRELEFRLAPEFVQYMRRQSMAENSVKIYSWAINRLINFARDNELPIIDREALLAWQNDLASLQPKTAALAGVGVRRMLHWAATAEKDARYRELAFAVPTAKYERLRIRQTLTKATQRELEQYLLKLDPARATLHQLRDRALYFYVKGTGARVGEILQVRRDRFEHDVVRHSRRSPRSLIPPAGVVKMVGEYLGARFDDLDCLWIAIKPNGVIKPLEEDGVLKIWERLARKVGVKPFTTRQLRQTAGVILVERGNNLADVMEVMGLKDIRSVQGYQQLVNDRLGRVRADLDVAY